MMHSIVYLSSSRVLLDEREMGNIVEKSRINNAEADITGVLIYCNGSIIQVLEGEKDAIHSLFEKIKRDDRHNQVIPLFQGPVSVRSFDNWAMGYSTPASRNMDELKDKLSFIEDPYTQVKSENKIFSLLQVFFKNNHRN
ncbi:BLUF domain-containing protein [Dyadobacter sp. CY327]|uniref:BLUF domain-containing protein n=1 Tax=Dyadobacter sp. CY327 TaxID=2907301 RepID=UPI001F375C8A|nr:BLUF domain-containing protein [Dyadobacter sp. CY327]MCE7071072.1 BLUF domain-containing protein [Dyadobacter sp. CY327]